MFVLLIKILVGFIGLIWAADRLVDGASALAAKLGISPLVIGLTIIAFGTSAPEIFVSLLAGFKNNTDIAIGNAIGSNIVNIGLVLAVCIIYRPMPFEENTIKAEIPFLFWLTLGMSVLLILFNNALWLGALCLTLIVTYTLWLLKRAHKQTKANKELNKEFQQEIKSKMPPFMIGFWVIIGVLLLPVAANILVGAASDLASLLGISDAIIGLTLVALGTSLPELATSLVALYKNEHHLVFGNIIGSNIFNLTAVLAPVLLVSSEPISDTIIFKRDLPFMVFITLLICARIWFNGAQTVLTRRFGIFIFSLYCAYIWLILIQTSNL